MDLIGQYFGRQVYWLDYKQFADQLPDKDWVCLAVSNTSPDLALFDQFIKASISKGILEFKTQGSFGEALHDRFDNTIGLMEMLEDDSSTVLLTKPNGDALIDTFWQCFFPASAPVDTDSGTTRIVCTDLDGVNRTEELQGYLKEFETGWFPAGLL